MMSRRINVFANLFLAGMLILFVVSLIYTAHRSEFYPPGTMNKFYIVFSAGIVCCTVALRLRQDYKINFVLSLMSVAGGVYLFELYLSCCVDTQPANLYAQAARAAGVPFDTRTKQQVFLDQVAKGIEIYPSVDIGQFIQSNGVELEKDRFFPLAGVSGKTTFTCNESGAYTIYVADEHGFNNPTGLYTADVDIALVGDSFTHGHCVAAGGDVASELRQMGEKVINLGYGGKGPLTELATLKEYAEPLNPKVVLWLYYEGNDLDDLTYEQQSSILLNYLDRDFSQNLFNRQAQVDHALKVYLDERIATVKEKKVEDAQFSLNNQLTQVIRLYHLRNMFERVFSSPSPSPSPSPLFEDILKEARDQTLTSGGKFYFVYLPAWERYATTADQGSLFHRDQVLSIVVNLNIPLIDMHQVFIQQPDPLSLFPFKLSGHYVAEGYKLVAATIKTHLETEIDYAITP